MARELSHRPPRGAAYHESAVIYNEGMATRARELMAEVEDKEVIRWCRSIARQHDEHVAFHRKSLDRLAKQKERKKKQRAAKAKKKSAVVNTEGQSVEAGTPTPKPRPIPRDPRAPKTIFTNNPIDKEAVETHVPEHLSLGDEKQEN